MNDWLIHARTGVTRHGYQQACADAALASFDGAVERYVIHLLMLLPEI